MKLVILFAGFTLLTAVASAKSLSFDCGRSMNSLRTLNVREKAPGDDGYTLSAIYKTSGVDKTTDMLTTLTYKLVGQSELSSELTGEEIPVYAFVDSMNPLFQVIIAKTQIKNEVVQAMEIDLTDNSVKNFNCTLK
jgi:hypothetical protein